MTFRNWGRFAPAVAIAVTVGFVAGVGLGGTAGVHAVEGMPVRIGSGASPYPQCVLWRHRLCVGAVYATPTDFVRHWGHVYVSERLFMSVWLAREKGTPTQ